MKISPSVCTFIIKNFRNNSTAEIKKLITVDKTIDINAVDEDGSTLLHLAVTWIIDTAVLRDFISFFMDNGGDIDQANKKNRYGKAAIDCIKDPAIRAFLIESGAKGKKYAAAAKIPEPLISGHGAETYAPVIHADVFDSSKLSKVDPSRYLGRLIAEGENIGIAFLIGKKEILCARHCLNHYALDEIFFRTEDQDIPIESVLEDGSILEPMQDYAILRLSEAPKEIDKYSLHLHGEIPAPNTIFEYIGYSSDGYPDYMEGTIPNEGSVATFGIYSFIDTLPGYSGSPYYYASASSLMVFGMHLKSSRKIYLETKEQEYALLLSKSIIHLVY